MAGLLSLLTGPTQEELDEKTDEAVRQYDLLLEYSSLSSSHGSGVGHCPSNMYVFPSFRSLYDWFGVLFVHEGLYKGAVIKFLVVIPKSHPDPDNWPKVTITSPGILHPLVHPKTGEVELKLSLAVEEIGSVALILPYIKNIFYKREHFFPSSGVRNEAFLKLLREKPAEAKKQVDECVLRLIQAKLQKEDPETSLCFRPFDRNGRIWKALDETNGEKDLKITEKKHIFCEWFCENYVATLEQGPMSKTTQVAVAKFLKPVRDRQEGKREEKVKAAMEKDAAKAQSSGDAGT